MAYPTWRVVRLSIALRRPRVFCATCGVTCRWRRSATQSLVSYRWFLDIGLLEPSFDPTVFTKNRRRLLRHDVAQRFFDEVVRQAAGLGLLSDEHFTVDGTLIEAAASLKSFRPKDKPPSGSPPDDPGNPTVNFHGERRSNATHQSTTDPEALLAKKGKGKEAHLSF